MLLKLPLCLSAASSSALHSSPFPLCDTLQPRITVPIILFGCCSSTGRKTWQLSPSGAGERWLPRGQLQSEPWVALEKNQRTGAKISVPPRNLHVPGLLPHKRVDAQSTCRITLKCVGTAQFQLLKCRKLGVFFNLILQSEGKWGDFPQVKLNKWVLPFNLIP